MQLNGIDLRKFKSHKNFFDEVNKLLLDQGQSAEKVFKKSQGEMNPRDFQRALEDLNLDMKSFEESF